MMWIHNNKEINTIEDLPAGTIGFIYIITNKVNGMQYIGKKHCSKGTKWQSYWGSSIPLKSAIKEFGRNAFSRDIIQVAYCTRQLGYLETKWLFKLNVLESENYYNANIAGKYFRKHINLFQ